MEKYELNMQVWDMLGKPDRDQNDINRMIAYAKSSLFHWYNSADFEPVNAQGGEWLISRVYPVLNRADKALEHAQNCLKLTEEAGEKISKKMEETCFLLIMKENPGNDKRR